jgi:3-dehydroquinate synthase
MRNINKIMENEDLENSRIYKNEQAWAAFSELLKQRGSSKIFVIADENTTLHCLPYFSEKIKKFSYQTITIPSGENHKNLDCCKTVWQELADKGADPSSLIINLGGGVVTDLGGFVASTFKRGVDFINIPTSLLAMVDAAVGGKNGVDLGIVKNQIGVIKNPELVLIDTRFLETLPEEQLLSGLAEMLKHGLIHSQEYWDKMKNIDLKNTQELETLIWESIQIKNEIVRKDPLEQHLRKTLNYGHTLGHAIESHFLDKPGKKPLLHGEAVAAGIVLATYLSAEMFDFPKEKLAEVSQTMFKFFPKQHFDQNDVEAILKLTAFDKKNRNGQVLFVLLQEIGNPQINCIVNNELIFKAFDYYKNF